MAKSKPSIKPDMPLRNVALRLFIDKVGLSIQDFAIKIGKTSAGISRLFRYDDHKGAKGKNRYPTITEDVALATAKAFNLPEDWLDKETERLENERDDATANGDIILDTDTRPHIFNTAAAGSLSEDVGTFSKPMSVVEQLSYYDYTITVNGDSMVPTYYSGDVVAVRDVTKSTFKQWGEPHVLATMQGTIIKRLYPDEEKKGYKCVSDNKEQYPPFTVSEDEIYGIYIVVGLIRKNG